MTKIYLNSEKIPDQDINGIKSLKYFNLGRKTYSAKSIEKIYGVFVSNVISAPLRFIKWNDLEVISQDYESMWIFVRSYSASNSGNIENQPWSGPYKGQTNDISAFNGDMIQIMLVMDSDVEYLVDSIKMTFVSSQGSSYFFTKAFNVGFSPKHLVLTYNGTINEDSIVRFAVAGEDTANISEYQYIEPNKIQELNKISIFSEKIKLMMEISGDSGTPVVIDEIALTFSNSEGQVSFDSPVETIEEPEETIIGQVLLDENGSIFVSEIGEAIVF